MVDEIVPANPPDSRLKRLGLWSRRAGLVSGGRGGWKSIVSGISYFSSYSIIIRLFGTI